MALRRVRFLPELRSPIAQTVRAATRKDSLENENENETIRTKCQKARQHFNWQRQHLQHQQRATRATTRTGGQAEPITKSSCSLAARWLLLLAACHLKSVCNMQLPACLPPSPFGWVNETTLVPRNQTNSFAPHCHIPSWPDRAAKLPRGRKRMFPAHAGAGSARAAAAAAAAVPFARLVARIELATQPARLALARSGSARQQAVGSRLPRFMASKRLSNLILATRLTFSALASVARRLLKLAKWQDYD